MHTSRLLSFFRPLAAAVLVGLAPAAIAQDRAALEREAGAVYRSLLAKVPAAKKLSKDAVGVLVFPKVTKAGLGIGGQYGDGVLFVRGKPAGYYKTTGVSYGLQAGAQQYGYAMFLMQQRAVEALNANTGFEVGVGPSVVVLDQATSKTMSTTALNDDIYAFVFSQKGLMAGMGISGNKITRVAD